MAILICDNKGQPYAKPYYEVFKTEPVSAGVSITIGKIVPMDAWHFPALLSAIQKNCTEDKDLLIAGHGTSQGLSIPLVPGKKKTAAQFQQLTVLAGKDTTENKAKICKITEPEVKQILALRVNVMKLKLGRIEFRACNMGDSTVTLAAYKDFLGAGTVGAPDMLDFFGSIVPGKPNNDSKFWENWLKTHQGARIYKMQSGRVALYRLLRGSYLIESENAMKEWIKAYLPATTGQVSIQEFPVHALVNSQFIFPNESSFVSHIKHYSKGNPLLQLDFLDKMGALQDQKGGIEKGICSRAGRRYPGSLGTGDKIPTLTPSNRGPLGFA
jgi:hypothetical protein